MSWLEEELDKWQEKNKEKFRADPKPKETFVDPENRNASSSNIETNQNENVIFPDNEFEDKNRVQTEVNKDDLNENRTVNEIKNINPNYLDANTVSNIEMYKHYAERKTLDSFDNNADSFQKHFGLKGIYNEFNKATENNFTADTFHKFILETPIDTFKEIHNDYKSKEYAQLVQSNTELQLAKVYGANKYTLSVDSILDEKKQKTDLMEVFLNKIIPFVDPFDEKDDLSQGQTNRSEIRGDGLVTQLYHKDIKAYEAILKDSVNEYLGPQYDIMPIDMLQETALGAESSSPATEKNYAIVNKDTGTYSFLYQDGLTDDLAAVGNSFKKDKPMWAVMAADIAIMNKLRGFKAYTGLALTGSAYSATNDLLNDYVRLPGADYTDPSGGGIQWGKAAAFGGISVVSTAILGGIPKAKYNTQMFAAESMISSDSVAIAKTLQDMGIKPSDIMSVGDFIPIAKALEKQINAITKRGGEREKISQKAFQEHFNLLNIIANGKVDMKALNLTDETFDNIFFMNEQAIISELKRKGLKTDDLGTAELKGGTYLRNLIDNYNKMNTKISAEGYDQVRLNFRNVQDQVAEEGNTLGFVIPMETREAVQEQINLASFNKVKEVKQFADDGSELPSEFIEGQINLSLFDPSSQALIKNIFGIEDANSTFGKNFGTTDNPVIQEGLFVGEGQNIFTSVLKLKQNLGELIKKEQVDKGYATSSATGRQATELMTILDGIITPNNFKQFNKGGDEVPNGSMINENIEATLNGLNAMNQFYKHNAKINEMSFIKSISDSKNADKLYTTTWREMVDNKTVPEKAEFFDSLFNNVKNLNEKDIDRIFPIDTTVKLDGVEVSLRDMIFPDNEAFKKMTDQKKTDKIISYIQDSYIETLTKKARHDPQGTLKEIEAIRANDNLLFKTLVGRDRGDEVLVALDTYTRQLANLEKSLISANRGQQIDRHSVNKFISEADTSQLFQFWKTAGEMENKEFQNYIASNYVNKELAGFVSGSGKETIIDFNSAVSKIDGLFKKIGKDEQLSQMIGPDAIQQLTQLRFVFDHIGKSGDAGTSLVAAHLASRLAAPEHLKAWTGAILDITRYNLLGKFVFSEKISGKVINNAIKGINTKRSNYYDNWHNQLTAPAIHSASIESMSLHAHFGTFTSEMGYKMDKTYEKIKNDLGLYSTDFPTSDAENKLGYTEVPLMGKPADLFGPLNNKPKIKNIFEEDEMPLRR